MRMRSDDATVPGARVVSSPTRSLERTVHDSPMRYRKRYRVVVGNLKHRPL